VVIKEYRCLDCETLFESSDPDPQCPACSRVEIERAFLTPPGISVGKSAIIDRELKNLANDYGMSDISNKNGSVMASRPAADAPPAQFAGGDPKVMQALAKLGNTADNFSGVLPQIRAMGGPRTWQKVRAK
jgi:hypothetical protein